jgi:hypothetical protein
MGIREAQQAYDNMLPPEPVELTWVQEDMIEAAIPDTYSIVYDIAADVTDRHGKPMTQQQINNLADDLHDFIARALEVFVCQ